jgi:hypothetical protein
MFGHTHTQPAAAAVSVSQPADTTQRNKLAEFNAASTTHTVPSPHPPSPIPFTAHDPTDKTDRPQHTGGWDGGLVNPLLLPLVVSSAKELRRTTAAGYS